MHDARDLFPLVRTPPPPHTHTHSAPMIHVNTIMDCTRLITSTLACFMMLQCHLHTMLILLHFELVSTWSQRHQTVNQLQVAWLVVVEVLVGVLVQHVDLVLMLLWGLYLPWRRMSSGLCSTARIVGNPLLLDGHLNFTSWNCSVRKAGEAALKQNIKLAMLCFLCHLASWYLLLNCHWSYRDQKAAFCSCCVYGIEYHWILKL